MSKKIGLTYIIDDDKIFVFVLKKLLEKNGSFENVVEFNNGEEVIQNICKPDQQRPNLILLDINMPLIDGWQFLDLLETYSCKDKHNVFIMTSSIDINDIKRAKNYTTVKDFISKPINNEKLVEIIEKVKL